MFLAEPSPTPYDLRWRMFGTDVRVHPLFWLISVVLGFSWFQSSPDPMEGTTLLALWVLCCFLSILLHEFGHIWMGRYFHSHGHIVLYSMGGLAIGSKNLAYRRQRIAVSFAGPGIQLLLWVALHFLCERPGCPFPLFTLNRYLSLLIFMLLEVNLYWALLNLLPIWPLDGGQICREVCEGYQGSRGTLTSLWISLVVCIALAAHAFLAANRAIRPIPYLPRDTYMAIMFALFAFTSFQAIQIEKARRGSWDDDRWDRWER